MWLYNAHPDYDTQQELLRCARIRFETLGMTERVAQVSEKLGFASLGGDLNKAPHLMTHLKNFSVAKGYKPLLRPLVIPQDIRDCVFNTV